MHWLIFAGLGPLIGAVWYWGILLFMRDATFHFDLQMIGISLLLAYIFGSVPALVAAAAVRQVQVRQVRYAGLWVGGIGVAVGLMFTAAMGTLIGWISSLRSHGDTPIVTLETVVLLVPMCLVPTLACWSLSGRFDGPVS